MALYTFYLSVVDNGVKGGGEGSMRGVEGGSQVLVVPQELNYVSNGWYSWTDTKKTVPQLPTIEIGFERLGSLE